ncbi:ComEC/Rec2 family competence protein [Asaia lannensis]|uniref:ComEC family competence protein n=1 Tax=Asaia lannensis NBRC 102526 TaxID=1307926 RepID=A0ABT1CIS8_9PROT|nr:ComEC/Rec2 family competence protein [Asaia lannensis]MCO6160752.1 ComEC family competence protein [Asaia lannensis NBRC 102526]GBQ94421.1 DNA translocation competence protein ComA/ComEC/Rec2 [Asaia lannensis NBRC 102526]
MIVFRSLERCERVLLAQGRGLAAWLAVAWAAGCLVYFLPLYEPGGRWASACVLTGGLVLVPGWKRLCTRSVGLVMIMTGLGFLAARGQALRQPPMPALPSLGVTMHGVVADVATRRDAGQVLQRLRIEHAVFETGVDIGMAPLRRDLLLFAHDDRDYEPGMTLRLRAVLRPPDWPDFPGARDRQREAWFEGLAGTGRVLGVPVILEAPKGYRLGRWRGLIASVIAHHLYGQRAAIASTLLAGHGEAISQQTRQDYAASGLAHILAVAGLHLGLVMGTVFFVTRQMLVLWPWLGLRLPCREIAAFAALGVGAVYVMLTGAHLPALRSLGMAGLATLALLSGRRVLSMRSLAVVAFVLLIASPVLVLDLSFQMSFAAVMALIAGYDALRPWFVRRAERGRQGGVEHHLLLLVLTSALAGGATLPLVMAGFGSFQPWFVMANLLAVPVAAFCVMPAGLCALMLMPLGAAAAPLWVMGQGIGLISFLASRVAALPLAHIAVPHMPFRGVVLYMAGLCGLCLWRGRARAVFLPCMVLAVLSPLSGTRPLVLVSPDAGLIAFQDRDRWIAGPHNGLENRILTSWQQAWPLPVTASAQLDSCSEAGCRFRVGEQAVRLQFRPVAPALLQANCESASLIVSAIPLSDTCKTGLFIDRFTVWRDGAVMVRRRRNRKGAAGFEILSDRAWRGARLWVPRPGFRGMPNLPLAREE